MKIITIFSKFQLQFQNFSESLFTFIIRLFTAKGFLWLSELNVTLNINKVKKWFLQKVEYNSANYKMESIFMFAFAFKVCFLKGKNSTLLFFLTGNLKLKLCILSVFVDVSKMMVEINAKLWLEKNRHQIWLLSESIGCYFL